MKEKIGTPCTLTYTRPYQDKCIIKLPHIDKLSPQARVRYKSINLYSSGKYSLLQIGEIFEINRSTFYRYRKKYNSNQVQSLEDRLKKPPQTRRKVARTTQVEEKVLPIRRKYPYFGQEKIQKILEREDGINISASSVGRILSQYRSILPNLKVHKRRRESAYLKLRKIGKVLFPHGSRQILSN